MGYNIVFSGRVPDRLVQDNWSEDPEGSEDLVDVDFGVTYNHDKWLDKVFEEVVPKIRNEAAETEWSGEWWRPKAEANRAHGLFRLHGLTAEEQEKALAAAIEKLPFTPEHTDEFGWLIYDAGVARRFLMIIHRIQKWWLDHPETHDPEDTGTWYRRFG
jgi:hypothetical protein